MITPMAIDQTLTWLQLSSTTTRRSTGHLRRSLCCMHAQCACGGIDDALITSLWQGGPHELYPSPTGGSGGARTRKEKAQCSGMRVRTYQVSVVGWWWISSSWDGRAIKLLYLTRAKILWTETRFCVLDFTKSIETLEVYPPTWSNLLLSGYQREINVQIPSYLWPSSHIQCK